jgi:hypothetical protein
MQSRDELIMEMADEFGLNRMAENDDVEDEDEEEDNDEGDAAAPPAAAPSPATMPPATVPEGIIIEEEEDPVELDLEQEALEELEVIALEVEP